MLPLEIIQSVRRHDEPRFATDGSSIDRPKFAPTDPSANLVAANAIARCKVGHGQAAIAQMVHPFAPLLASHSLAVYSLDALLVPGPIVSWNPCRQFLPGGLTVGRRDADAHRSAAMMIFISRWRSLLPSQIQQRIRGPSSLGCLFRQSVLARLRFRC